MFQPLPQDKRAPAGGGGIASLNTTNELAQAIRSLGQIKHGSIKEETVISLRVRVKTSASGPGKYNGVFLEFPVVALSASGGLADSDAGDEGSACLIFNRVERNQTTHALTDASNIVHDFEGVLIGYLADGTPVVEIGSPAIKKVC